MTETRPIDEITIGPRFRKDFGDIEALADLSATSVCCNRSW